MFDNKIMVTGTKESFLVKVLLGKMKEAGITGQFVTWNINEINAAWEGTSLITLYINEGETPPEDSLHYMVDKMAEDSINMIIVGEKNDIQVVSKHIPDDMIYKTFPRPLDNTEYINTLKELMKKIRSGDFKKSILVVDDDPSYLGLVREWLKDTYRVAMVSSGLQAIKWLGKNKADLILLDHEMPVTSGPQVLEMLRSDEDTKKIPVMFLTGKSDKESVMSVVALKPEGYFLKTIQKDELLKNLNEFFVLHKTI